MKPLPLALVAVLAPVLACAGPAAAQTSAGVGGVVGGILTPPPTYQLGNQFQTGQYGFDGSRDDKATRIDRRNSARFQAARMARKAREAAERDARRGG